MSDPKIDRDMGLGKAEARVDFEMGNQAEGKKGQTQGQTDRHREPGRKGSPMPRRSCLPVPLTCAGVPLLCLHTPGLPAERRAGLGSN